jgi:hypothetical protein
MVRLGFRFSAKLTLIASMDSSMLFIIFLDSGSSVLTFTVAFSLAPLDRCDRLGGEGLRSSSDPDEAEPLSSDPELSKSLSESYPTSRFVSPPSVGIEQSSHSYERPPLRL